VATPDSRTGDGELAVRVRGLRKTYVETHAVDGIDLDVRRGEVFALLGPNGAGKTTTVEILEGYRHRDAGDVEVLGHDPGRNEARFRARVGIVLQEASDLADLSVHETVVHFAGYYPRPRDPDEVIAAIGLAEKAHARASTLSGGQRRRLDVGLGIIGRPEMLFLDEPTTGFDPEARRQFWDLVRSLQAEGTTILLTTHYLDEAEALADRVGVISRGRLLEVGDPASLGGRSGAEAIVSWSEGGVTRTERTHEPTAYVVALSGRLGEVPELTVTRPSLEDVYLRLIGDDVAEIAEAHA
jgi:ABC-2 type transport system ATP-binding protein